VGSSSAPAGGSWRDVNTCHENETIKLPIPLQRGACDRYRRRAEHAPFNFGNE
jgi:hypothetical protein